MAKKARTVHLTDLGAADMAPSAAISPQPMTVGSGAGTPAFDEAKDLAIPVGGFPPEPKSPSGWPVYLAGGGAGALIALAPLFYVLGYVGGIKPVTDNSFLVVMTGLWAGLAALVVLMAAYMLQQGRRLAAEARHSRALAQTLLAPSALAAAQAGDTAEALRQQIGEAVEAAHLARERLAGLREVLSEETERLNQAAAGAARTAGELSAQLSRERTEMTGLGQALDRQSTAVTEAIGRQAKMVAEASDLAEAQLRESEAVLAARAADLAAAAGEASDTARVVSDDLGRQVTRLETAGVSVGDQMRLVGESLTTQRAGLVTAAHALRAEQEDFALQAEARGAQLSEFIVQARLAAGEVGDSAGRGAEALSELIQTARERLSELSQTAHAEREALAEDARTQMEALGDQFDGRRARLHAEFSGLNNAVEQAFEARMSQARDLVEGSALTIEQAGAAAVQRLDTGVSEARKALVEMQKLLADIDERSLRLPQEAMGRAAQVREAVETGIDELLVQARKAAEETQAIDAAFQERVRRNYEMLSEAVKLMGAATESSREAIAAQVPSLTEALPIERPLRSRLRLTPAEKDPLDELAEPAKPKSKAKSNEGWTWKEMISGLEQGEASDQADMLADIRSMGIDPDAMLQKSRVEDIAAHLHRRDQNAAREAVRKLAPAATRRLVRRLFSDGDFKLKVDRFIERYRTPLEAAAAQSGGVVMTASLLTSEGGRAYLLLDAASGELE